MADNDIARGIKIYLDTTKYTEGINQLVSSTQKYEVGLKKLQDAGEGNSKAAKNLEKQIKNNEKTIQKYNQELEKQKNILENLENASYNDLISVQKELQKQVKSSQKDTVQYSEALKQLDRVNKQVAISQKEFRGETEKLVSVTKARSSVIGFFAGVGSSIATFFTQTVIGSIRRTFDLIKEFESANANLAAILGTTRKNIQDLTDDALRLGAATHYTSSEVTGLQVELAKLGFSKQEILEATESVLLFADATGSSLPDAAKLAGSSIRAFGLETTETNRVVSALGVSTTKSALDFGYLQTALSTVSPVAKTFGFTIEDTIALLGTLANSGFDASSAATATRNILLNLANDSGKLAIALGRPVTNLDELVAGLKELDAKGIDLAKTLELTDVRSSAAFNTFLSGADSILTLRDSVTDVGDALKAMSDEKLNTVQGSIAIMESAMEGLVLRFYESNGVIKLVIDGFTGLIDGVGWCIDKFTELRVITIPLTAAFLAYVSALKLSTLWIARKTAGTLANTIAERANAIVTGVSTAAIKAKNVVIALYTGQTTLATVATTAWTKALSINPFVAIATAVLTLASAIYVYSTNTLNAAKVNAQLNKEYEKSRIGLDNLFKELKKTNPATQERKELIEKFNTLYPGLLKNYDLENAKVDELGKLQRIANSELKNSITLKLRDEKLSKLGDKYIDKQLYFVTKVTGVVKSIAGIKFDDLSKEFSSLLADSEKTSEEIVSLIEKATGSRLTSLQTRFITNNINNLRDTQKDYNSEIDRTSSLYDAMIEPITRLSQENTKTTVEETSLIKKLQKERANVQQTWKEDTEANIKLKNKELERLDTEIKKYNDLGKVKKKAGEGEYSNKIDSSLQPVVNEHKQRMLLLKKNRDEELQTDAQYNKLSIEEDTRFQQARIDSLNALFKTIPATQKKYRDEIQAKITESNSAILENQRKHDLAELALLSEQRDNRLKILDATYKEEKIVIERDFNRGITSQEQRDFLLLSLDESLSKNRLGILQGYKQDVDSLELNIGKLKLDATKKAGQDVLDAELKNAQDRVKQQKVIGTLLTDFKEDFNLISLPDETKLELKVLEAAYKARLGIIRDGIKNGLLTKEAGLKQERELEDAYNTASINITEDAADKKRNIQSKYGIATWNERLAMQIHALKQERTQGLIDGERYAAAEKNIKITAWKEAFDYYSELFGSAINALRDAEIANVEAKYDVEIEAAKGNSEEVERLENEKAEKKLEVEKKYADVQFAVKASQIIADTAVAIMAAMGQLGPIAGPIAAAFMGITGAAQLAAANAEREKIKNMTLNNSSSSKTPTAERVVNKGYSEGGFTGKGGRYEVAGVVHRGEYVVPMPEMNDPRVINSVRVIESIRRQRVGLNPLPMNGYAEGGYTGFPGKKYIDSSPDIFKEATENIRRAAELFSVPQRSYVVLSDFTAKQEMQITSEKPFIKEDN